MLALNYRTYHDGRACSRWLIAAALLLVLAQGTASAAVIPISAANFSPSAFAIGFNEVPLGTANPVYDAPPGLPTTATVSFGGYFLGQTLGTSAQCGGQAGCLIGNPGSELTLDPDASSVFTTLDLASSNNPVLSGDPLFTGSISVLFGQDQAGVGFMAGFADSIGANRFTAFDRNGNILGTIDNQSLGYSLLALGNDDGTENIAGVQLTLTNLLDTGVAAESLFFGGADQLDIEPGSNVDVPEPAGLGLACFMLGLIGFTLRRRRPMSPHRIG
ncbi:PEP-CTERM sorting domain-containing protein [Salinisphaera sp. T31B1]|uniref:PEP-CTERM sorting domain-containing protein n=1 Tax=Salinisphaera sp. T31B1 TaxID=727963 RepID=UPI0033407624